ncbi:DsbA family protein [Candidatus Micrarchaeota archaeon]|nr:DsbA family protein [Candidatus Micrarchaeota archaeon]MBU1929976.1 DsbA family protein [Candidatus Micrarchaeota archaeon]
MVFCIVALIVFGIMGIFSASHRKMAKEAFGCVFRVVTLRKCESSFDQKMKVRISTGLLKRNKRLGGFVFKHFEIISWIMVIITVVSLALIVLGFYNFLVFGNCDGLTDSGGFCIYNNLLGTGSEQQLHSGIVGTPNLETGIWVGSLTASLTVVEFGCFSCPYTKEADPLVKQALQEFDGQINVLWKPFPLPTHPLSQETALAAWCASEQGKFVAFKEKLFEYQPEFARTGERVFNEIAQQLQLDLDSFISCYESDQCADPINQTFSEGQELGIYGTPTFFVGSQVLVGPQNYFELKNAIEQELNK